MSKFSLSDTQILRESNFGNFSKSKLQIWSFLRPWILFFEKIPYVKLLKITKIRHFDKVKIVNQPAQVCKLTYVYSAWCWDEGTSTVQILLFDGLEMLRLLENADPENGKLDADWSKLLLLRKMEATNDSDRRLLIDITSFAGLHVGEPPFGSRDISHEITKLDIGSFFNLWEGWGLEESLECRKMTDEKEPF